MKKGFELIKPVLEAFPGLPEKLTNLFGKGKTWWYSHGYPLKADDPLSNGNLSGIDHALRLCDQYEAAHIGAGKALSENLIAELRARFDETEYAEVSDREIRQKIFNEFFEAVRELDKNNLQDKTPLELGALESELYDIRKAIDDLISITRAEKRRKE